MITPHKCPHCGNIVKIEPSQSRWRSRINEYLVMVAIFLAAGWALLNSGHMFWGAVSIVSAVILPILNDFCTRFQHLYPIRAQEKLERETELLRETARREVAEAHAGQLDRPET